MQIGREERQWLLKHGKKQFVDFQEEELKHLRNYFEYLDKDKGGSISVEELEEPLMALGFAENRDDVQNLIRAIDKNGNGEIELDEFLAIIKSGKQGGDGPAIGNFFKDMINGKYTKGQMPIPMYISDYRRKRIIEAMIERKQPDKKNSRKITQAFVKLLEQKKNESKDLSDKEEDDDMDQHNIGSMMQIEEFEQKLDSSFFFNHQNT